MPSVDPLSADAHVSYTVRDLFEQQNVKLDTISSKLDSKADKADLEHLAGKLDRHSDRLTALEESDRARGRARRTARWLVGIAATCSGAILTIVYAAHGGAH